jgi:hypothetical protein
VPMTPMENTRMSPTNTTRENKYGNVPKVVAEWRTPALRRLKVSGRGGGKVREREAGRRVRVEF